MGDILFKKENLVAPVLNVDCISECSRKTKYFSLLRMKRLHYSDLIHPFRSTILFIILISFISDIAKDSKTKRLFHLILAKVEEYGCWHEKKSNKEESINKDRWLLWLFTCRLHRSEANQFFYQCCRHYVVNKYE